VTRKHVNWSIEDGEDFTRMLDDGMTLEAVAEYYGIKHDTARRRLKIILGAPSYRKWTPELLNQAIALMGKGQSLKQTAEDMNVTRSSLDSALYKHRHGVPKYEGVVLVDDEESRTKARLMEMCDLHLADLRREYQEPVLKLIEPERGVPAKIEAPAQDRSLIGSPAFTCTGR
jgi:transposase-like protein